MKAAAFETATAKAARDAGETVAEQVTVRTASGTRTRLDLGMPQPSGATKCQECKSSATAPLTANQAKAFPEIEKTGAVVIGQGKPGLPEGTIIQPTKVEIVRPKE